MFLPRRPTGVKNGAVMHRGPSRRPPSRCSGHRVALVLLEPGTPVMIPPPTCTSVVVARGGTLATIEAAAIEKNSPSPPITASQSAATSSWFAPSNEPVVRLPREAWTARARHNDCPQEYVAGRSAPARQGQPHTTRSRQIFSTFPSRRSARQPFESSMPLGIRLGSSPLAAARTVRPRQRTAPRLVATGHRPTPLLIRARSPKACGLQPHQPFPACSWPSCGLISNHGRDGGAPSTSRT